METAIPSFVWLCLALGLFLTLGLMFISGLLLQTKERQAREAESQGIGRPMLR